MGVLFTGRQMIVSIGQDIFRVSLQVFSNISFVVAVRGIGAVVQGHIACVGAGSQFVVERAVDSVVVVIRNFGRELKGAVLTADRNICIAV